ncbi:MAG: PepSY-associated TM helix domain-containing protein [Planctomycetota bacterium]
MSERAPRRSLPWIVRWLHTYLSMAGFLVIVFFGITGLTLNHADYFEGGAEVTREATGSLETRWLGTPDDDGREVDKLAIVEHLRAQAGVRGMLSEFRIDGEECAVLFKGPGYTADALIDRRNGSFEVTETRKGTFALIDDLHKGRDTGGPWSIVVDVSAVVVTLSGLTGIWLLCYLKKRRLAGLLTAAAGTVLPVLVWLWFVR